MERREITRMSYTIRYEKVKTPHAEADTVEVFEQQQGELFCVKKSVSKIRRFRYRKFL